MKLLLIGMSHRTAALELRERFAVDDPRPALEKLLASDEVAEAVLLSTCNRTEVLLLCHDLEAARLRLQGFFVRELGRDGVGSFGQLAPSLYELVGHDAVRHAFRVASSVDSMVVGEPQILGQSKDAYRAAVECGACGPVLSRLYQRAFATAKRVRNETRIAERPVSVARVGVELAEQIFETLEDKRALLIGAGEMTELALEALRSHGLSKVSVANRTRERAAALASRFEAEAHGLSELSTLLTDADVVLTSIGGHEPVLTEPLLRAALRDRQHRPMFVIDLGVPRNVHPEVEKLDEVYRYDLDDLQTVAASNEAERRREVDHAEAIVREEEQRFDGWLTALGAVPTIRDLRARAESIRQAEIDRLLPRLGLSSEAEQGVDALTRALVNKILHAPLSRLRAEVEREEGLANLEVARSLFGLDDGGANGGPDPDEDPSDEGGGNAPS